MVHALAFGLPHGFEWLIILLVALLIFGPRLPRIMRGLGSSVREFRGGMEDGEGKSDTSADSPADASKPETAPEQRRDA